MHRTLTLTAALLLGGCSVAASPAPADDATCSPSTPCAGVTGFFCTPGESTESVLPTGALAHTVVAVYIVPSDETGGGYDVHTPIEGWEQITSDPGILAYDCPTDLVDGARGGNVIVFYDAI